MPEIVQNLGENMISDKVLSVLELDKVMDRVKKFLTVPGSADILLNEKPAQSFEQLKQKLALTNQADIVITHYNINPLNSYDDICGIADKAQKQITLSIAEIIKVTRFLTCSRLFKTKINELKCDKIPALAEMAQKIYTDKKFVENSNKCFISEEQIADDASSELYSIRKSIKKNNEKIKDVLDTVLIRYASIIQDSYITVRGGRYVIPVKAEHKNQINGLLHDRSASGATVYIEPQQIVTLNNELKLLLIKESEEIDKILRAFTQKISAMSADLLINNKILIDADIAFAKAEYAHSTKSVMPLVNSNGYMNIINGRHPLIDSNVIVPVTVNFGHDYNMLIITGPNTGGKTVTLKLCGLFCLMAMCGLYIPASDGTEISYFEDIYCDIGDEQSIENSLSTFSSHMKNIIEICDKVNENSLVLIDEIGAGTDPDEGAVIALSVTEYLLDKNCKGVITTHYNELKEYAFVNEKAKNACMEFDPVNLKPTYKLKIGIPGSSNALEISKKLGLKEEIISSAYKNLSQGKIKFEKVLQSADKARFEAEQNLEISQKLKEEYLQKLSEAEEQYRQAKTIRENALNNAKTEAKRLYANATLECEELIKEIKDIIKKEQIEEYDLIRARQINKKIENKIFQSATEHDNNKNIIQAVDQDLITGRTVYIKSLQSAAEIIEISKNKKTVTVKAGNIIIKAKKDDIYIFEGNEINRNKSNKKNEVNITVAKDTAPFISNEIKLIGQTVLDALPQVDEFINNCSVNGLKVCKIIHGIGTGKLRNAIWQHLKKQPLVKNFRSGTYGEGEKGVTIVELA